MAQACAAANLELRFRCMLSIGEEPVLDSVKTVDRTLHWLGKRNFRRFILSDAVDRAALSPDVHVVADIWDAVAEVGSNRVSLK